MADPSDSFMHDIASYEVDVSKNIDWIFAHVSPPSDPPASPCTFPRESDWASLPGNVAYILFKKLVRARDRVSIHASRLVCKDWASQTRLPHETVRISRRVIPDGLEMPVDRMLALMKEWAHVLHLYLYGTVDFVDACLERIHVFKNIKHLSVPVGFTSESAMRALASLETLEICERYVSEGSPTPTNDWVASLLPMRGLSSLTVYACQLDDGCMQHLSRLKSLTFLHMFRTKMTRMPGVGGLTALTELRLRQMDLHPAAFLELGSIPALRYLTLEFVSHKYIDAWKGAGVRFRDERVAGFARLTDLTWVCAGGFNTGALLSGMASLESVSMALAGIDAPTLSAWRMPNLRKLDIGSAGRFEAGSVDLRHLTALTHLDISSLNMVDDDTVASLRPLTRLTMLDMSSTRVTEACAESLRHMTHLRHLDLGTTDVDDDTVASLLPLTELTYLGLERTELSVACVESLTRMTWLKTIDLSNMPFAVPGQPCIEALEAAIPGLTLYHGESGDEYDEGDTDADEEADDPPADG